MDYDADASPPARFVPIPFPFRPREQGALTTGLTARPALGMGLLGVAFVLLKRHGKLRNMLEGEGVEGGPGSGAAKGRYTFSPALCSTNSCLWELALLQRHYNPDVATQAKFLSHLNPESGQLPQGLPGVRQVHPTLGPVELAKEYAAETWGHFRPTPKASHGWHQWDGGDIGGRAIERALLPSRSRCAGGSRRWRLAGRRARAAPPGRLHSIPSWRDISARRIRCPRRRRLPTSGRCGDSNRTGPSSGSSSSSPGPLPSSTRTSPRRTRRQLQRRIRRRRPQPHRQPLRKRRVGTRRNRIGSACFACGPNANDF